MDDIQQHYDAFLAEHYLWKTGKSFDENCKEQRRNLEDWMVFSPVSALDLGCGPGIISMALDGLGAKRILAVDFCQAFLDYVSRLTFDNRVDTLNSKIEELSPATIAEFDSVFCLGDTITHLPTKQAIRKFLQHIAIHLKQNGQLVLGFRELGKNCEKGSKPIPILVRGEPRKLMTCLLDGNGESAQVTDLLHVFSKDRWTVTGSSYRKIALSINEVVTWLEENNLRIVKSFSYEGQIILSAIKPDRSQAKSNTDTVF